MSFERLFDPNAIAVIGASSDLSRINKAFFDFNAYVSSGYFLANASDIIVRHSLGTAG